MTQNSLGRGLIILCCCWSVMAIQNHCSADSPDGYEVSNPANITLNDIAGEFMQINFSQECFLKNDRRECETQITPIYKEYSRSAGINLAALTRLNELTIKNRISFGPIITGSLELTAEDEEEQSVSIHNFPFTVNLSELPERVRGNEALSALITSLHPAILGQVFPLIDGTASWLQWLGLNIEMSPEHFVHQIKPTLHEPPAHLKAIVEQFGDKLLLIDLGNHYTMLVKLSEQQQPEKLYMFDRLANNWVSRNAADNLYIYTNIFGALHHLVEVKEYGENIAKFFAQAANQGVLQMLAAGVGIILHPLEFVDHASQSYRGLQPETAPGQEATHTESLMETGHLVHSVCETALALYSGSDPFILALRSIGLATTLFNFARDHAPASWVESSIDELLTSALESEGITALDTRQNTTASSTPDASILLNSAHPRQPYEITY